MPDSSLIRRIVFVKLFGRQKEYDTIIVLYCIILYRELLKQRPPVAK